MSAEFIGPMRRLIFGKDHGMWCVTGSIQGSQPVRKLRSGFYYDECGSLDATEYVAVGGFSNFTHGGPCASVQAEERRELMAQRAEPERDPFDDCYWPDVEECAA